MVGFDKGEKDSLPSLESILRMMGTNQIVSALNKNLRVGP